MTPDEREDFEARPMRTAFVGCDTFRAALRERGFSVALDSLRRDDEYNWYAYRPSNRPARECEQNDGKRMQIVVTPYCRHGGAWESAEVDLTGEAGGVWFKLCAYSLKLDELLARLDDVERSLIAAWNALR